MKCRYCNKEIDFYTTIAGLQGFRYRNGILNKPVDFYEDDTGWLLCTPHQKETYYHEPTDKSDSFKSLYNKLNE